MDITAHNAFVLFLVEHADYETKRSDKRRVFLEELIKQMILPYIGRRNRWTIPLKWCNQEKCSMYRTKKTENVTECNLYSKPICK